MPAGRINARCLHVRERIEQDGGFFYVYLHKTVLELSDSCLYVQSEEFVQAEKEEVGCRTRDMSGRYWDISVTSTAFFPPAAVLYDLEGNYIIWRHCWKWKWNCWISSCAYIYLTDVLVNICDEIFYRTMLSFNLIYCLVLFWEKKREIFTAWAYITSSHLPMVSI